MSLLHYCFCTDQINICNVWISFRDVGSWFVLLYIVLLPLSGPMEHPSSCYRISHWIKNLNLCSRSTDCPDLAAIPTMHCNHQFGPQTSQKKYTHIPATWKCLKLDCIDVHVEMIFLLTSFISTWYSVLSIMVPKSWDGNNPNAKLQLQTVVHKPMAEVSQA